MLLTRMKKNLLLSHWRRRVCLVAIPFTAGACFAACVSLTSRHNHHHSLAFLGSNGATFSSSTSGSSSPRLRLQDHRAIIANPFDQSTSSMSTPSQVRTYTHIVTAHHPIIIIIIIDNTHTLPYRDLIQVI